MCKLCETNPVYEFTNQRKLCARCFIRYFQKKFLYTIRKFKMIKNKDVLGYKVFSTQGCTPKNIQKNIFTRGNFRDVVLEDALKMFAEKSMVELIKLPTNTPRVYPEKFPMKTFTKGKKKITKIAVSSTLDLEANEITKIIVKLDVRDLKNVEPIMGNIVKPLYLFLDKEILLYAKLKNLKFKEVKVKETKLSNFINELEKKHPEIKRAIVNSFLKLQC